LLDKKKSTAKDKKSDEKAETSIDGRTTYSPPIKTELIGTDNDTQLVAAVAHLKGDPVPTTADAN
jgi:hypothetical protein